MSPYEQISLGCKCCVGYNNLNYTAKVFINLYSCKQCIYSSITSQAFSIVRFKLFCQTDGCERVFNIFEIEEWCWVAMEMCCLDHLSERTCLGVQLDNYLRPQCFEILCNIPSRAMLFSESPQSIFECSSSIRALSLLFI